MLRFLSVFGLLAACVFTPARAETTLCTNITSLPAVISTQGVYCLKQDLSTAITSGNAITISTNNVTLDCNGWKLGGLAAGVGTNAYGIRANDRLNLTVRNCGVRGFFDGIHLNGGASHLIEDNRVDQSTSTGIFLAGDGHIVRRNRVVDTGGRPNSTVAYGIFLYFGSSGALISDNTVINVAVTGNPEGNVDGLHFEGSGHEIARNLISNLANVLPGQASGIRSGQGIASIRDNTVINDVSPNSFGTGIYGGLPASHCKGNTVHGFAGLTSGCTEFGSENSQN